MQLIKETNLYDDEAINRKVEEINASIEEVNARVVSTYGKCTTSANVAAKVVSLADFVLYTGARITVQFTYANTAANPTLNVNGTGAKPIWARNAAIIEQYYWSAQSRVDFIYDGDHWTMPNAKTQSEIFNELTNNGAINGLFMQNNQIYFNATYINTGYLSANRIQGGTLSLGGSGNTNGLLEVHNASSTVTCRLNNAGLYAIAGTIGNFTIGSSSLYNGMTSLSDTTHNGVYVGTDGIALGKGVFKVTSAGVVTASNITVTGGSINGGVITAGKIQSANQKVYFDLSNNILACDRMISTDTNSNVSSLVAALKYKDSTKYGFNLYRNTTTTGNMFLDPATSTSGTSTIYSDGGFKMYSLRPGLLASSAPSVTMGGTNPNGYVDMACNGTYIRIYQTANNSNLVHILGSTYIGAKLTVTSGLSVSGTKNRKVDTNDYGERLLYCYEMPSPMFGDVGEGTIAEDGKCYIWIDSIFSETVSLNQYQVFLQKYGYGDCWISEKTSAYFIVEGTPNMNFGWEIKAKQSDFDQLRLEKEIGDCDMRNNMDYADELIAHIEEIHSEREVAA